MRRVHAERQRRAEHERVVLAEVVVERRVAALDGAVLHGVEHLQARTISPPAKVWIWNLLSVSAATRLPMYSAPP